MVSPQKFGLIMNTDAGFSKILRQAPGSVKQVPPTGGAPRASAVSQTRRTISSFVCTHGQVGGDRAHESINVAGVEDTTDV